MEEWKIGIMEEWNNGRVEKSEKQPSSLPPFVMSYLSEVHAQLHFLLVACLPVILE